MLMLMVMLKNEVISHITGKYSDSVHRGCNINVELNHKIPIVSLSLKNYD